MAFRETVPPTAPDSVCVHVIVCGTRVIVAENADEANRLAPSRADIVILAVPV